MLLLDSLELYMSEGERYDLYPADFIDADGVTYKVSDNDEDVADIRIKMSDGETIDGIDSDYDYDDVYADVDIDGDVKDLKNKSLIDWILRKLSALGYDKNPANINGDDFDFSKINQSDQIDDESDELEAEIKDEVEVDIQDDEAIKD